MPPLVAPPHMADSGVDSAYMDWTSLREASDRSRLRSTTLLPLPSDSGGDSATFACAAFFDSSSFFSADSGSSSFSSATLVSGGGESQIEEEDDEAESASPELTPEELGVLGETNDVFSAQYYLVDKIKVILCWCIPFSILRSQSIPKYM